MPRIKIVKCKDPELWYNNLVSYDFYAWESGHPYGVWFVACATEYEFFWDNPLKQQGAFSLPMLNLVVYKEDAICLR